MNPVGEITSIEDLFRASHQTLAAFPGQPWWRGHAHLDWKLVPHVFRLGKGPVYEANIANKFAQRAPTRHARCPAPGDLSAWLFLMQHYGLPTRLLDWTESPLVAAYFAVTDTAHINEDGALWGLDPYSLNDLVAGKRGLTQPGDPDARALIELAFSHDPPTADRVLALVTAEIDLRMLVQLSGMTIHESPAPLEARARVEILLHKYVIPSSAKRQLEWQLRSLGVRERNVFPDLEHLADDLARDEYAAM